MDEATFKERVKRLNEINKVVEKLDPAIREQAFALLESYVGTGKVTHGRESGGESEPELADEDADLADFVGKLEGADPADTVKALAAFLYKRHGKAPFTAKEINELANEAGLTVPDRVDATLRAAKDKGKALFRKAGKGFTPTVQGEAFFKDTYKIKKGKLPKPSSTESSTT